MDVKEFVLVQLEWLQRMYEESKEADTRDRIITAIEDIVIAALGEHTFPNIPKENH